MILNQAPLTSVTRGLEGVATERPPADRKDVSRVVAAPVVERASPAIKRHVDLIVIDVADSRGTDQLRVLVVHGLQLRARLERVRRGCRRGLHGQKHKVIDTSTYDRVQRHTKSFSRIYVSTFGMKI